MDKQKYDEMKKSIVLAMEEFEKETGFQVQSIEIRRTGCTASSPNKIYGLYVPIAVNKF